MEMFDKLTVCLLFPPPDIIWYVLSHFWLDFESDMKNHSNPWQRRGGRGILTIEGYFKTVLTLSCVWFCIFVFVYLCICVFVYVYREGEYSQLIGTSNQSYHSPLCVFRVVGGIPTIERYFEPVLTLSFVCFWICVFIFVFLDLCICVFVCICICL